MNNRWLKIFFPLAAFVLLVAGLLTLESPSLVRWQPLRAMVLESDDWGLAGFVPHGRIWEQWDRQELDPGRFPPVYWGTTLEDSLMVAELARIMGSYTGADGLPAVFQPNYVLSSLSLEQEGAAEVWKRYDLPEFPPTYRRPGMWTAVRQALADGVWYPEFHAAWHYDPQQRLDRALSSDLARSLSLQGVTLFPGSERARELGPARSVEDLSRELDQALGIFADVFGRPASSVIAPDYTWSGRMERIWLSRQLRVIQGKREQRDPTLPGGTLGRGLKFLYRKLSLAWNRDRVYLERNCRLEPVQDPDPDRIVAECLQDVLQAWDRGQPAIVETHRVNFAHTDPAIVRTGQEGLSRLLDQACGAGKAPTFMSDAEVAQLQARGTSAVFRGSKLIMRNGTHSRRLVAAPRDRSGDDQEQRIFALGPGEVRVLPRE